MIRLVKPLTGEPFIKFCEIFGNSPHIFDWFYNYETLLHDISIDIEKLQLYCDQIYMEDHIDGEVKISQIKLIKYHEKRNLLHISGNDYFICIRYNNEPLTIKLKYNNEMILLENWKVRI